MALMDFSKALKKTLQTAESAAKTAAGTVKEATKDLKIPEINSDTELGQTLKKTLQNAESAAKTAAGTVKEATKDIKISEINKEKVSEIFKKVSETAKAPVVEEDISEAVQAISTWNAMKVIYYLMAVDGTICHGEEEKFDGIGKELVQNFPSEKERLVQECQTYLDAIIDPEDFYDVLQDAVEKALMAKGRETDAYISPRLLIWDLLTIAYSDENYDETERRLLKYIVRKLNIDKSIFLEMESSYLALVDLEKELNWIKTTDRPYLTIEATVNEIADRKNVIFESVKDLITL